MQDSISKQGDGNEVRLAATDELIIVVEHLLKKKYVKFGYSEHFCQAIRSIDKQQALDYISGGHESAHVLTNNRNQFFFAVDPYLQLINEAHHIAGAARAFTVSEQWHIAKNASDIVDHGIYATSVILGVDDLRAEYETLALAQAAAVRIMGKNVRLTAQLSSPSLTEYFLRDVLRLHPAQIRKILLLASSMTSARSDEAAIALGDIIGSSPEQIRMGNLIYEYFTARKITDLTDSLRRHHSAQSLMRLMDLMSDLGFKHVQYKPDATAGHHEYGSVFFEINTTGDSAKTIGWGGRINTAFYGQPSTHGVGMQLDVRALVLGASKTTIKKTQQTATDIVALVDAVTFGAAQPSIDQLRSLGLSVLVSMDGSSPAGVYAINCTKDSVASGRFETRHPDSGELETHSIERIVSIVKDYRNS